MVPSWPTFAAKNGRLGVTRIPGFVPLPLMCSLYHQVGQKPRGSAEAPPST